MPTPVDFRTLPLAWTSLTECGRYQGRLSYWRLYAIENYIRIIAHSVLTVQISPGWVSVNLSRKEANSIQAMKARHRAQPFRANPGNHDVYFLSLGQLTRIITQHSAKFTPWIPDIGTWIVRIESVQLPRNIVGHMNWLNPADSQDINGLYMDLRKFYRHLPATGLPIQIP